MSKEILGTLCTDASDNFGCGFMHGMCKTIKARGDIGVVEMEVKVIGQLEGGGTTWQIEFTTKQAYHPP